MIQCYTCQNEIIFDKNIKSKTGKQIPLWPDKQNAHGHDENGNPIRQPLPQYTSAGPTDQVIKQQEQQPQAQTSIDRPSLDQVLLNQISQSVNELKQSIEKDIKDILNSCYELEKQHGIMLNALIEYFKLNQPTTANQLWNQQQNNPLQTQQGSNPNPTITDPLSINHGKIADLNELKDEQEDKVLEEQGI